jgi:thiol reductant ABC exporter CydC subunit
LLVAALLAAAASGCAVGLMATSAWLIARASQHPPVLTLMVAVVAVRAFGIGRAVLRYGERLMSHDAAFAGLGDVRVRVYRRLERLAPAGLPHWRRGDLLTRLVNDVDDLADLALRGLLPILSAVLVGGGTLGLAVALLPSAALVLAAALALAGVLTPWLWVRAARTTEQGAAAERADRSATILELLDAAPDLTACDATGQWLARIDALEERITRREATAARIAGAGLGIGLLAASSAVLGTIWVAVPVVSSGSLAGPTLAVLVLTPLALTETLQSLPAAAQVLQRVRASAGRVLAVLDAEGCIVEPDAAVPLPDGALRAPHLQLRGVTVRWPGGARAAVSDLDLELPPGHRVAIVGASGAGKSTVLAALLRFIDPQAGTVTVNGVDARLIEDDQVRSLMAMCDQQAYLFDSTIAENVRLGRAGAADADVLQALRQAQLGDWVAGLPDGIDTRVGEHGAQVSGGQRQRIAVARALLADRPVLLLDEPTAGLDEATARALMSDLLAATNGRTVVLITHRPEGIDGMDGIDAVDEIIRLDHGKVVHRTHAGTIGPVHPSRAAARLVV